MTDDVTRILSAIENGDPRATEELLPLVYDELRRLARQKMRNERADATMQPTALVHEAFLRLVGDTNQPGWDNRGHFFAAAALAMRRILIEAARRRRADKRGGDRRRTALDHVDVVAPANDSETLLALDEALSKLQQTDPPLAQLVELRYFAGLTIEQTAAIVGRSPRSVKRDWTYARAWLKREMDG